MYGWNGRVKFQVLIPHTIDAAIHWRERFYKLGISISDLRETEILCDADDAVLDRAYILVCTGHRSIMRELVNEGMTHTMEYEGLTTIY